MNKSENTEHIKKVEFTFKLLQKPMGFFLFYFSKHTKAKFQEAKWMLVFANKERLKR